MTDFHVGSASVDIVPDARGFQAKLDEKLRNLTATVRIKVDDKLAETELSQAARDRVAVIQAKVEDRLAKTQLRDLTRPRKTSVTVDDKGSIDRTNRKAHLLLTTIVALTPAAAPLAAAAVGIGAAFVGLGVAGVLAFKGIEHEMAAGTVLGQRYTRMVNDMKSSLGGLERTAAAGVVSGLTESVALATAAMPALNSEVAFLSSSLGSDLVPLTRGVLALFRLLSPVVNELAGGAHSLAVDFAQWAEGPGGRQFAAYLAVTLPQVEHTLAAIATAAAHIVQALLPLGGPVLSAITGLSDAISVLPVHVIEALFLAFAGYKTVLLATAAVQGLTKAVTELGTAEAAEAAAGGAGRGAGGAKGAGRIGGLIGSGGLAGPVGLAGTAAFALIAQGFVAKKENEDKAQAAIDALAQNPAQLAAAKKRLQALQAQRIQLNQQSAAAPGDRGAFGQDTNAFQQAASGDVDKVNRQISALNSQITQATAQQKAFGIQTVDTTSSIVAEAAQVKSNTVAFSAWTKVMDDAFTKAYDVKNSQVAVHQALADANRALKDNGRTLDLNTQKGRDNRLALLNLSSALHDKVDADIAAGRSQDIVNADLRTARGELVKMAEKFGLSKVAAQRYADALLKIPKHITTTITAQFKTIDLSSLTNQAKAKAKALADRSVSPHTGGYIWDGALHRAGGGPVFGDGGPTADLVPSWLSNGEYVLQSSAVSRLGVSFLNKLNQIASYTPPALGRTLSAPAAAHSSQVAHAGPPGIAIAHVTVKDVDEMARVLATKQRDAAVLYQLASVARMG